MIEIQRDREAAYRALTLLGEEMVGARLTILPVVGHADLLALDLAAVAPLLDEGTARYDYVDRFFVWSHSMPAGEALFYEPAERVLVEDPTRLAVFPEGVWKLGRGNERWGELPCLGDEPACQIIIHRVLDEEEASLLAIVGFTVDLRLFSKSFLPSYAASILEPAVQGFFDEGPGRLTLVDEGEGLVLGTDVARVASPSSVEFPLTFTLPSEGTQSAPLQRWHLAVGDEDVRGVQEALHQGAIGNVAIVAAGLVVLALGSALMARSSAREAKLSDLKSRFISGISHELKTPLSNIRLYSEMLELGRVPTETERKSFYQSLRQQAELLGEMLEEILDFSRLEAEQRTTRFGPCELDEILEDAVEMRDWSRSPQSVDVELSDELPLIQGNRSALVRVFHSLLDNASKYSAASEPITVKAHRLNGMIAVDVVDRGVGIAAEDLPHLFERFYRGRTSGDTKGAGLGLSIAQSVVVSHGGRIEVESTEGVGSRFTVLLPVRSETS